MGGEAGLRGVATVARGAQCAAVLRVVGVHALRDKLTASQRIVVRLHRWVTAEAAHPPIALHHSEAESVAMFTAVPTLRRGATNAVGLPARLRQAVGALATLDDPLAALTRRRRLTRHGDAGYDK